MVDVMGLFDRAIDHAAMKAPLYVAAGLEGVGPHPLHTLIGTVTTAAGMVAPRGPETGTASRLSLVQDRTVGRPGAATSGFQRNLARAAQTASNGFRHH